MVEPRDRAAAGADRNDIDQRTEDRPLRDLGLAAFEHATVLDDCDIIGGAADVGTDDVRIAEAIAEELSADHAAGGPGHQRADRLPARGLRVHDAAARLHNRERAHVVRVSELVFEVGEVRLDRGLDEGVQHRRRGPLIFAPFRGDLVRD